MGDFNAKMGREDIFKSIIDNESLREASNNSRIREENFATLKNLIVKSKIFPCHDIHKHIGLLLNVSHIIR
jgi:hypothetical protein